MAGSNEPTYPMSNRALSIRFSLLVGGIFLVLGLFLPFWSVLLESRGLDAGESGLLLAAATWVKIIGLPVWGGLADRRGDARSVLLLGLCSFFTYLWLGLSDAFLLLLLGHITLGFVFIPLIPLTDSTILQAGQRQGIDYARVRVLGIDRLHPRQPGRRRIGRTGRGQLVRRSDPRQRPGRDPGGLQPANSATSG